MAELIPDEREQAWEEMRPILDARPDLAASAEGWKQCFARNRE